MDNTPDPGTQTEVQEQATTSVIDHGDGTQLAPRPDMVMKDLKIHDDGTKSWAVPDDNYDPSY